MKISSKKLISKWSNKQPIFSHLFIFIFLSFTTLSQLWAEEPSTIKIYLSGKGHSDATPWNFKISAGRKSGVESEIPVPSCWEQQGFGNYYYGHEPIPKRIQEVGIYKRSFFVPKKWENKLVRIVFEGVMTDTQIKINGSKVGTLHQGAFTKFHYNLNTKYKSYGDYNLKYGETNELEVTVWKESLNESLNLAERKGDYWVFGGIYRPVYLEVSAVTLIERVAIDAKANGEFKMDVFPHVFLGGRQGNDNVDLVTAQIEDLNGKPFGTPMSEKLSGNGKPKATFTNSIGDVQTWSPENPKLYVVRVKLHNKGVVVHEKTERFGFRTFEVRSKEGLYLNGNRFLVKGVNRNFFRAKTGRTLDPSEEFDDVKLIKSMNANLIRSHLPSSKDFLDACDELGLLYMSEITTWQLPVIDTPILNNIVLDHVTYYQNHPSLIFWLNGNEDGFNPEVNALFRLLDLQERHILHPWSFYDGIYSAHYPAYNNLKSGLSEDRNSLYLPTEFLHGLYDGGHGAGLEDFWKLMESSPLSAGGVLWCLDDNAIMRTDKNNELDTAGNYSADGLFGPNFEKEASFYTIRSIWSPIQITNRLPDNFSGTLLIRNKYIEQNLSDITFKYKIVSIIQQEKTGLETKIVREGEIKNLNIKPGEVGVLKMPWSSELNKANYLEMVATDKTGCEIMKWGWSLGKSKTLPSTLTKTTTFKSSLAIKEQGNEIKITQGKNIWVFDKTTGRISELYSGTVKIGLKEGFYLSYHGEDEKEKIVKGEGCTTSQTITENQILLNFNFQNSVSFQWKFNTDGSTSFDYQFPEVSEKLLSCAVGFNIPKESILSKQWVGNGPERIWNNRKRGPEYGLWGDDYNENIPGEKWGTPFKGIFSGIDLLTLNIKETVKLSLCFDESANVGVLIPDQPLELEKKKVNIGAKNASFVYPEQEGIFIFHIIPSMGTKFKKGSQLGPQGEAKKIEGKIKGSLVLYLQ